MPLYYVASEDLFSNGFISRLLEYVVAPIPINKSTSDLSAIRKCVQVAKEGGSIALFPEGNRTYSGTTEYIKPAIAKLVRFLRLPVMFVRIEGGYGVQPRWSSFVRKGHMSVKVSRIAEYEEYKSLSDDQFYDLLTSELYVDDVAVAEEKGLKFFSKDSTCHMERAYFYCPDCGFSSFESSGNIIKCCKCGIGAEYQPDLTFKAVNGNWPYKTTKQWYDAQQDYVKALTLEEMKGKFFATDEVSIFQVNLYKNKKILFKNAEVTLYGDRLTIKDKATAQVLDFPFEEVSSMTLLGRNKMNLYSEKRAIQFKGSPSFNPMKIMNLFYHYTNLLKGDIENEFLGL